MKVKGIREDIDVEKINTLQGKQIDEPCSLNEKCHAKRKLACYNLSNFLEGLLEGTERSNPSLIFLCNYIEYQSIALELNFKAYLVYLQSTGHPLPRKCGGHNFEAMARECLPGYQNQILRKLSSWMKDSKYFLCDLKQLEFVFQDIIDLEELWAKIDNLEIKGGKHMEISYNLDEQLVNSLFEIYQRPNINEDFNVIIDYLPILHNEETTASKLHETIQDYRQQQYNIAKECWEKYFEENKIKKITLMHGNGSKIFETLDKIKKLRS